MALRESMYKGAVSVSVQNCESSFPSHLVLLGNVSTRIVAYSFDLSGKFIHCKYVDIEGNCMG